MAKLEEGKRKQYINMKIEGYLEQDRLANREIDKNNYVDYDWFLNETKTVDSCYHCGVCFCMIQVLSE